MSWAERDYADMPKRGEGGARDLQRAMEYFKRAVGQDYPMAGFDIAEMAWSNPDLFPGPVKALACCLWAWAMPPMSDASDFDGVCADAAAALFPEALAEGRVMATSF